MKLLIACLTCALGSAVVGDTAGHGSRGDWTRVVSLLQYIEGDYVEAIEENSAGELAEQAEMADAAAEEALATGTADPVTVARLRDLAFAIREKSTPIFVHETSGALIADIVRAQGVPRAPSAAPDLAEGEALYGKHCAPCHADRAGSMTQMGRAMTPHPPSFFVADVVNSLTPWKTFNLVSHGIPGTPMPSFATLSDRERWAIAFFVFTLREPTCTGATTPVPLEQLSTLSDNELVARFGEPSLPCLRRPTEWMSRRP